MKFGHIKPSGFREEVIRKCGRTTEATHPISSPGAIGSEEIKTSLIWVGAVCSAYLILTINLRLYGI